MRLMIINNKIFDGVDRWNIVKINDSDKDYYYKIDNNLMINLNKNELNKLQNKDVLTYSIINKSLSKSELKCNNIEDITTRYINKLL